MANLHVLVLSPKVRHDLQGSVKGHNDANLRHLPMNQRNDASEESKHGKRRQSRDVTGNRAEQEQNAQAQMNMLRLEIPACSF